MTMSLVVDSECLRLTPSYHTTPYDPHEEAAQPYSGGERPRDRPVRLTALFRSRTSFRWPLGLFWAVSLSRLGGFFLLMSDHTQPVRLIPVGYMEVLPAVVGPGFATVPDHDHV